MSLDLAALRAANASRRRRWHGEDDWSLADWSNAMCGEAGEAANLVKKIRRHETGVARGNTPPLAELHEALAGELADVLCYLDLLALKVGVDLAEATIAKFNVVSERSGFPERLEPT